MCARRKKAPARRAGKPRLQYTLRLYIAGVTPRSSRAVSNIKEICEKHFPGRYELQIVDLYQQPELTAREQIIAAPTLVRTRPLPQRRLVGDMTDVARVVAGVKS